MNADEKYLFDLNGYLVVKNVLTPEEVAIANEAIDKHNEQGRIRPREQALDGGSLGIKKVSRGEANSAVCSIGRNRGVIRSDTCLHTRHSSRI